MYTRSRHTHEPIPSIFTFSPYPSPSHILNKADDITWQSPPDTFLRPDPITHPLTPFPPPPPLQPPQLPQLAQLAQLPQPPSAPAPSSSSITRGITKPSRNPHLPAEKNAALKAAKIAKECHDLGPHTTKRFKCPFPACDKFFQRRYNFKVHVRKHTKETPYTCTHAGCGKKFRWRSSISHHLKAHNKRSAGRQQDVSHVGLAKMEDKPRRRVTRTQLPTSPISSGTGTGVSDKFQGFGLEHVPLVGGGDVGVAMDELSFDHEHVSGMMFDNMM